MSVRIQYTIPGWEPALPAARLNATESGSAFDAKLRESATASPESWHELLRLGRPQPGEFHLTPPPRPAALSYSDVDESRRRWHGLLGRRLSEQPSDPKVAGMLTMLAQLQEGEDAVAARTMMDSRG
ncbi:MAG: hypothetical protein NTW28_09530 [Candidatus Solibacter sp.]|nr:hypothetical protein [Candidatus Solibacter sp.]